MDTASVEAGRWGEWSPSFGVLLQGSIALVAPPALLSAHGECAAVLVPSAIWSAGFNTTRGLRFTPTDRERTIIIHQKSGLRWKRSHCLQVEETSCSSGPEEEGLKPYLTHRSRFSRAHSPWVLMYRRSLKPYRSCSSFGSQDYT